MFQVPSWLLLPRYFWTSLEIWRPWKEERETLSIFLNNSPICWITYSLFTGIMKVEQRSAGKSLGGKPVYTLPFSKKTLEKTHSGDRLQGNWKLRRQTYCRLILSGILMEINIGVLAVVSAPPWHPRNVKQSTISDSQETAGGVLNYRVLKRHI